MPRITISYRRDDSLDITGRIFDRLAGHFGREAVFRDIDNIPPGVDFRRHIDRVLGDSEIVLAIVGPRWIGPDDKQGRLASPADPVRLEIETALRQNKPLLPVLVSHAVMPDSEALPDSLQDFAYRNAVQVDGGQDFDVHVGRLIHAIERIVRIDQQPAAGESGHDTAAIPVAPQMEPSPKAEPATAPMVPHSLYLIIAGYAAALLIAQDWGSMIATAGWRQSGPWLLKMGADVIFIGLALYLAFGVRLLSAMSEYDDLREVLTRMRVSDRVLFGAFLAYIGVNLPLHAQRAVTTTGAESWYWSIWTMGELFGLIFFGLLFRVLTKAARSTAPDGFRVRPGKRMEKTRLLPSGPLVQPNARGTLRSAIVLGLVVLVGVIGVGGWWGLVEQPAEIARQQAAGAKARGAEQARQAAAARAQQEAQARQATPAKAQQEQQAR